MPTPTQTKGALAVIIIAAIAIGGTFAVLEVTRQPSVLRLATTTSTYDSGLLDDIVPAFEQQWGVTVEIISVGTGQALATGQSGDCDVVMVHSRSREDAFIANGYGIHRVTVWWNDFIIIGPPEDPAGIDGLTNATEAFIRIYNNGQVNGTIFASRGDGSGTESKELAIWATTGLFVDPEVRPSNTTWYKETGAGMGDTLVYTNEQEGYTLADRGTWIARMSEMTALNVLTELDPILLNPYGVMLVDPGRFPNVNFDLAVKFVAYLCSNATQTAVNNFRKQGQVLFKACYGTSNSTDTGFDTDEQVAEQLAYWEATKAVYGYV